MEFVLSLSSNGQGVQGPLTSLVWDHPVRDTLFCSFENEEVEAERHGRWLRGYPNLVLFREPILLTCLHS